MSKIWQDKRRGLRIDLREAFDTIFIKRATRLKEFATSC